MTAHLGLDIAAFFSKDSNFETRMADLEKGGGHKPLADYLRQARAGWSQQLIDRRNDLEHKGWVLADVKYPPISNERVRMMEPQVDGVEVSKWVAGHSRRVIAFVEDTVSYAFQATINPKLALVETPRAERDPSFPRRFNITFPGIEALAGIKVANRPDPWTIRYDPNGFE